MIAPDPGLAWMIDQPVIVSCRSLPECRHDSHRHRRRRPARPGPTRRRTRRSVVERMIVLLQEAASQGMRPRRVPRTGADHVLPALVRRRHHHRRSLLRTHDAERRDPAVVRRGEAARRSASASATPCSEDAGRRHDASLERPDARRARRAHRRHVQEGAHPRPCGQRAGPPVPARRAVLLRAVARRVRCVGRVRWAGRDDDLQRPSLARDVSADGVAGRRADPVWLQHAAALRTRPDARIRSRGSTTSS